MTKVMHWLRVFLGSVAEFFTLVARVVWVLFEQFRVARRFLFFWAIWIVTDSWLWFKDQESLSAQQQFVLVTIIGLLSIMIAFYQWSRMRDHEITWNSVFGNGEKNEQGKG